MVLIFLLILITIITFVIFSFLRSNYGFFHIIPVLAALSLIDVFIPFIILDLYGYPDSLYGVLDVYHRLDGVVYYIIFYSIFFIYIITFTKKIDLNWHAQMCRMVPVFHKRGGLFLIVTGGFFAMGLLYQIDLHGGVTHWIYNTFTLRFNPDKVHNGFLENFFILPWRTAFNFFVLFGFFLRHALERPKLYGFVLPLISIMFSISTSYRGSILMLMLGFIFLEMVRIKIHRQGDFRTIFGNGYEKILNFRYYFLVVMAIIAFMLYGAVRSGYVEDALGYNKNQNSVVYQVISQGSSLEAISSIVKMYGNDLDYLYGKTYIDMLLLPVPRFIYTSKPKWYGIDDITRNMGGSKSTQSAVSMPGEAYANFGWYGLFIAVIYGAIFAAIINSVNRRGGVYIIMYALYGVPLLFVMNWMSFTGFMNLVPRIAFIMFLVFLFKTKFMTRSKKVAT
jgi:hypothetical protein